MNIRTIRHRNDLAEGAEDPQRAADLAIRNIAAIKQAKAQLEEQEAKAKGVLHDLMDELQLDKIKTKSGTATIVASSVWFDYDAKAIDVLATVDPDFADKVEPFRRVKERKSYVRVIA